MAPPVSRRSKQNSSPSPPPPIPLAGIAVGLFAAIAAGFAASRLRRRKPVQSLQDEHAAISAGNPPSIPLLVQEREIEIKEKDDLKASAILLDSNGTIAGVTHEPAKRVAVFDAFKEASLLQKNGANPVEEGWQQVKEEEEEDYEFQRENAELEQVDKVEKDEEKEAEKEGEDDEGKKAETLEDMEIGEEEGETANIIVKIEASLVVDEAFMDALDLGEKEEEDKEDEDDTGTDQQPFPVLFNGRILDFLEETSDLKDDTDLLSSGSYSLSDAISESSMQEVSSAPVKPLIHAEEAMEASWTTDKPDFVCASDQLGHEEAFSESRNCSSLPYTEKNLPEIEENLNHFEPDVDAGVTVTVEIEGEDLSTDKVNQIKLEVISDFMDVRGDSVALQGEVSIEVKGLDEGFADSARINGKVLSDDLSLREEQLSETKAIEKCEHVLPATEEGSDDITRLEFEEETIVASVCINGNVLSDDSPKDPSVSEVMATDEADGTVHCSEPDLQAIREVSGDNLTVNSELVLHLESIEEVACTESVSSKELLNVDGISEKLGLQSGGQDDDVFDATCAIINEKSVDNVEHEQLSSSIASTEEKTQDNEHELEASTGDSELDYGRKDDDGLAEATILDGRLCARQQEIEEMTLDLNNLNFTSKSPASVTDSACVSYNHTREIDHLVSKVVGTEVDLSFPKGAGQKVSLQAKGRFLSRFLKYLPLEIGVLCLLIALVSFVLWYLEVMSSRQS